MKEQRYLPKFVLAAFLMVVLIALIRPWQGMLGKRASSAGGPGGRKGAAAEETFSGFVGEKITYDVKLGRLTIGEAHFVHQERTLLEGRPVNLMVFSTRVKYFNDVERIYSDPESFLPVRVERTVRMWPSLETIVESYNQAAFTLNIAKTKGKATKELLIRKTGAIHNAVLLPYCVRAMPHLEVGWSMPVRLPTQEFVVTLVAKEEVTVPAGTFKAFRFMSSPEKFEIWITADQQRIPVKIVGTSGLGYTLLMREHSL